MAKFIINHVNIVPEGIYGPWGYALVSGTDIPVTDDGTRFDTVELRGLGLAKYEKIQNRLPEIRENGQILGVEADVDRFETRVETFTKDGRQITKNVLRVYLDANRTFFKEDKPEIVDNLDDVLGDDDDNLDDIL